MYLFCPHVKMPDTATAFCMACCKHPDSLFSAIIGFTVHMTHIYNFQAAQYCPSRCNTIVPIIQALNPFRSVSIAYLDLAKCLMLL